MTFDSAQKGHHMWELVSEVTEFIGAIAAIISSLILLYPLYIKYRKMSCSQVEQEIAKICRRQGMYTLKGEGDLRYISNELIKIKSKGRLPEEFGSQQHSGDREAAIFRFLINRGWKSGQENFGTCRIIYKLPDKYRRP